MRPKTKPYAKLRALMLEKGITQGDLAKILGISRTAMSSKFTGRIPFTVKEIKLLKALLGFESVDDYFFAE